jgi:hypothetical protein
LCTEAALNAIQRHYPQIYKTSDRLLLDPSSICIQAKDFMMSIRSESSVSGCSDAEADGNSLSTFPFFSKEIIPSSARSASSSAAPLPAHLQPLLNGSFEQIKKVVHDVLPVKKRPTVLEEAEWEDEQDGSFAKEMMLQGKCGL